MKRLFVTLLTITALFVTSACGDAGTDDAQEGPTPVTVTARDSGSTKTLAKGDQVVIELETSGGSGYSWTVSKNSNTAVVEMVAQEQEKTDAEKESGMVGTPEVVRTTFEAKSVGTSTIELAHVGPTGGAPDDTFTLTVVVE